MSKIWFITGSGRGLGRSLTEAVLSAGDIVFGTARNVAQLDELQEKYPHHLVTFPLDVSDKQQIGGAVNHVIATFGHIDVLVNNAGFGITGAAEAFTEDQIRSQLYVNLLAPIAITRAVLPFMRKRGQGRIVQISSIGGRVGNAGLSIYQAAKFGLSGFSESLSKEVNHLGIKVTSIEPGGFRTDWAGDSMSFAPDVDGYEKTVAGIKELFTSGKFIPKGDPAKAANAIIQVVNHPTPPVHLVLGSEAVGILKKADERRQIEMEQWLTLSLSTDHDDNNNFYESAEGKKYLKNRGIEII